MKNVEQARQRTFLIHRTAIDDAWPQIGKVNDLATERVDHPGFTQHRLNVIHPVKQHGVAFSSIKMPNHGRVHGRLHLARRPTELFDPVHQHVGGLFHAGSVCADRWLAK